MSEMKGLEDFREYIERNGYATAINVYGKNEFNECNWYAWRPVKYEARECDLNKRVMSITVWPFQYKINDGGGMHHCVEVEICGEVNHVWFRLKAFSMSPDKFLVCEEDVEKMLVRAWNGLTKGKLKEARR